MLCSVKETPHASHASACGDNGLLKRTLLHPGRMLSKAEAMGPAQLAVDYVSPQALADRDLKLCQQALTLSQTAIRSDTRQLPMQVVARLRNASAESAAGALAKEFLQMAQTINADHPQKGARCTLPHGGEVAPAGGACVGTG